jgi:hypothetical protein
MGINWSSLSEKMYKYYACASRRLTFAFADAEEKRFTQNKDKCVVSSVAGREGLCGMFLISSMFHQCRAKLLWLMAMRIMHLEASLGITVSRRQSYVPVTAPNGVPLPVAVGILRGGAVWSVLFMWRDEETKELHWRKLVEKQRLDEIMGFLHYTTFMYRLFCYGRLFKEAIQSLLDPQVSFVQVCAGGGWEDSSDWSTFNPAQGIHGRRREGRRRHRRRHRRRYRRPSQLPN